MKKFYLIVVGVLFIRLTYDSIMRFTYESITCSPHDNTTCFSFEALIVPWGLIFWGAIHYSLRRWVVPIGEDIPLYRAPSRYNPTGEPAYYSPKQPIAIFCLGLTILALIFHTYITSLCLALIAFALFLRVLFR